MKLQKNKSVAIKKKMSERIVLLALFLMLSALFLFVLFMPFHRLVALDSAFDNLCYAIGGVGTVLFFVMSAYQFYHIVAKSTAIIVTEEGIYDFVTGGKGVGFIDKGKITSIRIFGTVKKPILGIQVDNSKHLIRTAKKCVQDAVLYNLDMNMPAIVIYQKDLSCPVKEAASIIYEKINSAALSVEDVNKASTKVASETRAFTNEPKKDTNNKAVKQAEEAKQVEAARLAEEAKQAEAARLAEEAKRAEAARLAEEAKRAEAARLAEEAKQAEVARLAEEAKPAEKVAGIAATEKTEERTIPKYVFPPERFIKPGPQTEEDPSPEPYFEELRLDA